MATIGFNPINVGWSYRIGTVWLYFRRQEKGPGQLGAGSLLRFRSESGS